MFRQLIATVTIIITSFFFSVQSVHAESFSWDSLDREQLAHLWTTTKEVSTRVGEVATTVGDVMETTEEVIEVVTVVGTATCLVSTVATPVLPAAGIVLPLCSAVGLADGGQAIMKTAKNSKTAMKLLKYAF